MNIKKIYLKIFKRKKYIKYKDEELKIKNKNLFEKNIKNELDKIDKVLKEKKEISFLHSGHLGDVINSLPLIKEIAKNKKCNLFIEANWIVNSIFILVRTFD